MIAHQLHPDGYKKLPGLAAGWARQSKRSCSQRRSTLSRDRNAGTPSGQPKLSVSPTDHSKGCQMNRIFSNKVYGNDSKSKGNAEFNRQIQSMQNNQRISCILMYILVFAKSSIMFLSFTERWCQLPIIICDKLDKLIVFN